MQLKMPVRRHTNNEAQINTKDSYLRVSRVIVTLNTYKIKK